MAKRLLVAYLGLLLFGCYGANATPSLLHTQVAAVPTLDTAALEQILGMKGTMADGVFKISRPRSELSVSADGFPITPRMGLTAWAAFRAHGRQAMVMGDIPLTQDELQPVISALEDNGVGVSALHNHFIGESPRVMFLHVSGMGEPATLARGLRAAFDTLQRLHGAASAPQPVKPTSRLDTARLDAIFGVKGDYQDGVYKITVPRPAIHLEEMGVPVNSAMGFNSWAALEGSDDHAVVDGDVAMVAGEVDLVVKALRHAGISVVALHNHMLREQPRLFYLHFWGVGRAEDLANGVRVALDRMTAVSP